MNTLKKEQQKFSIGPLIPIKELEGETIIVSNNRIAALSSAEAIWWVDSVIDRLELPYINVDHARWSTDGSKIFAGTGIIHISDKSWEPIPQLASLTQPMVAGQGGWSIKTTSWSDNGQFVAILLIWLGPKQETANASKVLIYNLETEDAPISLPVKGASKAYIVNDYVVVSQEQVSVWTFEGKNTAQLSPILRGANLISVSLNKEYLAFMDDRWCMHLVDTKDWSMKANWPGYFRDAVFTQHGLIALDLKGQLHGACFIKERLEMLGTIKTGLFASQLEVTLEGQLIMMGVDSVSVHSTMYQLFC